MELLGSFIPCFSQRGTVERSCGAEECRARTTGVLFAALGSVCVLRMGGSRLRGSRGNLGDSLIPDDFPVRAMPEFHYLIPDDSVMEL